MPISRRTLLATGGTLLAAPHVARAAVTTYRLGYNLPATSHYGKGAAVFAAAVAADPLLAPVMAIELHPNSELGDELTMLKDCAASTLDFYLGSISAFGTFIPALGVLDAPYLFKNIQTAHAVLDGPVGTRFAALTQAQNMTVLAFGENGLRHMTANIPIRTPADLKGLKLRVPQNPVIGEGLDALGASTGELSFKLLPDALRTGQFQGEENSLPNIESAKLYEYQKVISLTGHIYGAAVFTVSNYVAQSLSAAQNQALAAAAIKGAAATRAVCGAAPAILLPQLQTQGMTVVSDVDVGAFRAAAQPFLQTLSEKFGAALINPLLAANS